MSETFTLYKLIILYMLNKVDFPLTTSQISEFVLDKGYTTYFKLQEAISELTQSELIRTETTHNRTLYHLTESGAETIHYFSNKISSAIRKDIDDFLTEKQYDLKRRSICKSRLLSKHKSGIRNKMSDCRKRFQPDRLKINCSD